jgi:hypothetical protein
MTSIPTQAMSATAEIFTATGRFRQNERIPPADADPKFDSVVMGSAGPGFCTLIVAWSPDWLGDHVVRCCLGIPRRDVEGDYVTVDDLPGDSRWAKDAVCRG